MLWLKRNRNFNQLMKCDISEELIGPGDYYYQDDVDGVKIKAQVYKEIKDAAKRDSWDYSKLNNAQNEQQYRQMLQSATRQILGSTILDRKVAGKYDPNPDKESEFLEDIYNINGGKSID